MIATEMAEMAYSANGEMAKAQISKRRRGISWRNIWRNQQLMAINKAES